MRKYLLILLVVLVTGCIFKGHYKGYGISFDHPIGWECGRVMDLPSALVSVRDPSGDAEVIIFKEKANTSLENRYLEYIQKLPVQLSGYCYRQVSNRTLTVDASKAYELVYAIGCDSTQTSQQTRLVILQKGEYFYIIDCRTTPKDFERQNPNFDIIINSLDIL
ncbi:MAG: PsbP-related protein [Methanothermobacter sp.]|nr:PsbP-related protein [Methanothermobacter sp.]